MSEVKILITAQTAEAAAAIQTFAQNSGAAFKNMAAAAGSTHEALTKVRETSMLTREAMRGLETAALLSGNRMGGEFVRGTMLAREGLMGMRTAAMLTGASLGVVGIAIAGVAAVAATGVSAWQFYSAAQKEALGNIETTTQIYAIRNRLADLIDTLVQAKKLTSQSGDAFKNMLFSSEDPKTLAGNERFVQSQLRVVMPNKDEQKALDEFQKVQDEAVLAQLDGIDAERVKITRKEDELLGKLDQAAKDSHGRIKAADLAYARDQVIAATGKELDDANEKEFFRQVDEEIKATDEMIKKMDEAIAADERLAAEAKKRTGLEQEIARAQTEAGLVSISNNPQLSDVQKNQQSLPLYRQQMAQNSEALGNLQSQFDETSDLTAQLELRKQMASIMVQQAELQTKINTAEGQNSFTYQFGSALADLKSQWGTWASQAAASFKSVFNSAIQSISNGITGLIMGTMRWKEALTQIGNSILTSIVQAITQMGVRWVLTQIMMATVGKSVAAASAAALVPIAVAQSAIWAAPATLATIASYGEAAAQAPAFIMGAQAMTLAQSMTGGAAGFESGGYTGAGGSSDPAGIVHRGEFVFSAPAVNRLGLPLLDAMHSGQAAPVGQGGGGGGNSTAVYAFTDPRQMADHIQRNDAHEKWVVDVMSRNIHKFR